MPVLALLLAGCQPEELVRRAMHRMAPDEDEALAQQCLEDLRTRNYAPLLQRTDPQILRPGLETNLVLMADAMDRGTPLAVELVGCNILFMPPKRFSNLTYQYQFSNAWVLADITLVTQNAHTTGQILFNPLELNFQLGGVGLLAQGLYAPWVLSVSFPLGALIFLFHRFKPSATPPSLKKEALQATTASEPPAGPGSAPRDW